MRTNLKYTIVKGVRADELVVEVCAFIAKGWCPSGGAFYVEWENRFYQSMIKEDPEFDCTLRHRTDGVGVPVHLPKLTSFGY